MVKIDKGVPIPVWRRGHGFPSQYPILDMKVGDSIFVPGKRTGTLRGAAQAQTKRMSPKWTFTTRKVTENGIEGRRLWRTS